MPRLLLSLLLFILVSCGDSGAGGDGPRTTEREDRPCSDTDGDGVCDSEDRCDGDDAADRDEDGRPDDCDACPLDPDNDADGDGFCAGDDICLAGDDTLDADGDGVPNACDACPTDNPDDSDRDGVCDLDDQCPEGNDADDVDGDGTPDACDPCPSDNPDDSDFDGVCDAVDACEGDDSLDADGDGVPDACDVCDGDDSVDSDADGVPDDCDECLGDADTDTDGDGAPDACDLCPGSDDAADADSDGVPDGCDECPAGVDGDSDGVCDDVDPCPVDNPDDSDSDGVCESDDVCPADNPDDSDSDGVCESDDACPGFDDAADGDGDGVPDGCDTCPTGVGGDADGDGVCDGEDRCEGSPDGVDVDGDGVPDGCDACDGDDSADSDGDGICDTVDDCPGGDGTGPDLDGDGTPDECEPVGGSYQYTRAEIGGLRNANAVAFHPSGDYALILERYDRVHVYDSSGAVETVDLSPVGSGRIYWSDVEFSPGGDSAILIGYDSSAGSVGAALRFDHAAYLVGSPADAFIRLDGMATRQVYEAVVYRHDTEVETALLLSRNTDWPYQMWLDDLDPATGETSFLAASAVGAGCEDVAAVDNEFGNPGYLVICGRGGYDGLYWTEVGGVWELRTDLGNNSLGNSSRILGRPDRDYALVVQNSSSRIYRFAGGVMNSASDAPWFSTRRMWTGSFDSRGLRALIVGQRQAISGATFGGVFEYRHDEYECSAPLTATCDIREVSIPNFDAAPWSTPSSTFLSDIAWRPDCDGGLIVGGKDNFSGNFGLVARFELEGGTSCW